ncbi:hypothetical protein BH23ACT9_BH23ACT9_38030 [soil metagenome]
MTTTIEKALNLAENVGKGRLLVVIALVLGLGAGFGAAFLLGGDDGSSAAPAPAVDRTRDGDPEALADLPDPDPVADAADATDPEAALRGFLAAEAAGEWEVSYDFLIEPLRELTYTSPAAWIRAHADFPQVTGYRIDEVVLDEEAGRATVRTLTGFEPVIDPVLGLVAARGRTDWTLQQDEDGLWRVNAAESENRPLYPAADGAEVTARRWVDARVACDDTTALEGRVIGTRALADRLCEEDQDDEVVITDLSSLTDSSETTALISEFGPEVFTWSRTVIVRAASPFTLVLGPLGDQWVVVGVLNQS